MRIGMVLKRRRISLIWRISVPKYSHSKGLRTHSVATLPPLEMYLILCLSQNYTMCGDKGAWSQDIRCGTPVFEEGELEVAHLLPVDHLGVEVQPEFVDQHLDVADRDVGVPAAVDVEHQRAQAEFRHRQVQQVELS